MTNKHEEMTYVLKYIKDRGFEEVLEDRFDNIDNVQFHKLRDRYRKAREALNNYIIKHSEKQ